MATLAFRPDGLAKLRDSGVTPTGKDFAERIGVDPATVSRVLTGKSVPGPRFIAGVVAVFGIRWFQDFFEVVADGDAA